MWGQTRSSSDRPRLGWGSAGGILRQARARCQQGAGISQRRQPESCVPASQTGTHRVPDRAAAIRSTAGPGLQRVPDRGRTGTRSGGNRYPIRYRQVPTRHGAGRPDPTAADPGSASHRPPAQGQHHQPARCGRAESHASGPAAGPGRRFRCHRRVGLPGSRPGPPPPERAAAIEGAAPGHAAGPRPPEAQPPFPPTEPPDRPGDRHRQGRQQGRRRSPANP